jgi:transposase-like protein
MDVMQIGKEEYRCNQCGRDYSIRNAIPAKGNVYFCSMECVLNYEDNEIKERLAEAKEGQQESTRDCCE